MKNVFKSARNTRLCSISVLISTVTFLFRWWNCWVGEGPLFIWTSGLQLIGVSFHLQGGSPVTGCESPVWSKWKDCHIIPMVMEPVKKLGSYVKIRKAIMSYLHIQKATFVVSSSTASASSLLLQGDNNYFLVFVLIFLRHSMPVILAVARGSKFLHFTCFSLSLIETVNVYSSAPGFWRAWKHEVP